MLEPRVHPEGGAGEAGVSEAADGEDGAAGAGEGGVDVPAEAAGGDALGGLAVGGEDGGAVLRGGGLLGLRHQLQRGLLEGEGAGVVDELVEEGLGVERDVVRGGEDSGVSGYSAHAAGGGVVDGAAEEMVEVRVERRGCLWIRRRGRWGRC